VDWQWRVRVGVRVALGDSPLARNRHIRHHRAMGMLVSFLVLTAAVWLTAMALPGFKVEGVGGAMTVALLFGLINWAIGWLLFGLIGIGTLGIGFLLAFATRWVVNAIVLKIVDGLTDRLTIDGFGWALAAGACMSGIGTAAEYVLK